jgi:hypothetical protein
MNIRLLFFLLVVLAEPFPGSSAPFTYQGVLTESGRAVESNYDLLFRIYGAANGGVPLADSVYAGGVGVRAGHFVVLLDFGDEVFNGQERWLEIAVRPADGLADYTILTPRQLITAAPYAMSAANVTRPYGMSLDAVNPTNSLTAPVRINGDSSQFAEMRVEGARVSLIADDASDDHQGIGLTFQAGNAMGPDRSGGNILLLPGFATGQGRAGRVVVDGDMKITGSLAATALSADGSGIRNLAASNLIGVVGNQHFSGTYANPVQLTNPANEFRGAFIGDGSGLSNVTASVLLGGLPSGGLAGTYVNAVQLVNPSNLIRGTFIGDGSGLTNIPSTSVVGVLGSSHLEGAYSGAVQLPNPANQFRGTFAGDGSALSNLTAATFSGILPNSALSGTYTEVVNLANPLSTFHGMFYGSGAGLSNLAASRLVGALPSEHLTGSYSNAVQFGNTANQFVGAFQGDGTALSLSASRLTGTVPGSALTGTYGLTLNLVNPANNIHGTFTGNASSLSNVNASKLDGLASADFAQRHASNHFSAPQAFAGPVRFSNSVSITGTLQVSGALTAAALSGDGSGLRNVAVSNTVGVLGSSQLQGAYANPVQLTSGANQFTGTFSGNGAGLTSLNAATLTGLVPNSALGGTYGNALNLPNSANTIQGSFAGDGSHLTNLTASNIVGVLASAHLQGAYSNTLQFNNSANQFNGTFTGNGSGLSNLAASTLTGALPNGNLIGTYGNALVLNNSSNRLHGSFIGDASGLTNVATANLVGLLSGAQLSGTYANAVQLTSPANHFRGTFTGDGGSLSNIPAAVLIGTVPNSLLAGAYNNVLTLANPANTVHGSFNGNGNALSNLNASALTTGTVPDARLSANIATLSSSPVFSGSVTAQADVSASRVSAGTIGVNTTNPVGRVLLVNGAAGITATNTIEFGANIAGKHVNAGKIGYQTFTPGALDIVGAGTNLGSRRIKFWAESGATFNGGGTNPVVTLLNIVDEPTAFSLVAPFRTWRIGQNKPPDSPNIIDAFYIRDETANATRLLITDTGRIGLGTNNPTHPLHLASGAHCTAAGVWTSVSDRNAKEDFAAIDTRDVLAKVASLPITAWKYKIEPEGTRHVGPTAQDFHATFGLGESDKAIGMVDAAGVALAAIQGLNEQLKSKEQEMTRLREKNLELERRLETLESAMRQFADAQKH